MRKKYVSTIKNYFCNDNGIWQHRRLKSSDLNGFSTRAHLFLGCAREVRKTHESQNQKERECVVWWVCAERRDGAGWLAEGCNTPLNRCHGKCLSRFFTLPSLNVRDTPTADQSVTWDANYKHQRQANNIHNDNGIGFGSGSTFHINSEILKQKIIIINKKCIFARPRYRLAECNRAGFPMLLCYIYKPVEQVKWQ